MLDSSVLFVLVSVFFFLLFFFVTLLQKVCVCACVFFARPVEFTVSLGSYAIASLVDTLTL